MGIGHLVTETIGIIRIWSFIRHVLQAIYRTCTRYDYYKNKAEENGFCHPRSAKRASKRHQNCNFNTFKTDNYLLLLLITCTCTMT